MTDKVDTDALQQAHDILDDQNAKGASGCIYCFRLGHDSDGQKHFRSCLLVQLRRSIRFYLLKDSWPSSRK